jgi:hypothetical protein
LIIGVAALAICAFAQQGQVLWDNHPETPQAQIARGNLNPYNSIRPEYRDPPPSHGDLEKIWQHHLQDHVYKSPFVRPMKSGLWESGVPNRYAPGGYNRRKFKTEEEALLYVRHKTGAGMDVDYQAAKPSEKSFLEISGEPKKQEKKQEKKEDKKQEKKQQQEKPKKQEKQQQEADESEPEKQEDQEEHQESEAEEQLNHDDDEQEVRDHNLKIAHKIREFLANYNPNKPIHVVKGYGSR